jgi:hypothetical protein
MFDSILAFFDKTWVKVVAWIGLFLNAAVLILGGTGTADIDAGVKLVFGIIEAIGLAIAFVVKMLKKKQKTASK